MLKLFQNRLSIQRSSLIYILAMSIGSVANYLLYPLLQTTLSPTEFSQIATTLAIFGQLSGVLLALNVISLIAGKKKQSTINKSYSRKTVLIFFFITGFVLSIIYPYVAKQLELPGALSYLLVLSLVVTSIPSLIIVGKLQSNELMIESSTYTLMASTGKLILAFIMSMRYGIAGATWGIIIGQIIGLLSVVAIYKRVRAGESIPENKDEKNAPHAQTIYIIIICAFIGLLQNSDTLLGRYILDGAYQYNYIIVSSLSNVAYFGINMLAWIYLSKLRFDNFRSDYRTVLRSIVTMLLVASVCVLISSIVGKKIIFLYSKIHIEEMQLIYNIAFQALLAIIGFLSYWLSAFSAKKTLIFLLTPTVLLPILLKNDSETSGVGIIFVLLLLSATQLIFLVLLSLLIRNSHNEV